jgi:DNA-binding MarR family transcriptional regulator
MGPEHGPQREAGDAARLTERQWRLLLLIGQHGDLNTRQVAALMFNSRPTAARDLQALVRAGLLVHYVLRRDSSHLAHYRISAIGVELLTRHLRATGQPVPVGLGERGRRDRDQLMVNDIFVRLVVHARSTGRGHLYRWRHSLDSAVWLRAHGVHGSLAHGFGLWIEDGAAVSFVLHLDHDEPSPLAQTPPPPPSKLLAAYARTTGVPFDAALVVTTTIEREQQLHRELAEMAMPLVVASTTYERLDRTSSPSDAIWSVTAAPRSRLPLIEVARVHAG